MPSSSEAATVKVDGDVFEVIRVTPTQVTLVSRTTGETAVKRPDELTADAPVVLGKVRSLGALTGAQAGRVETLAVHLQEVATGIWHDGRVRDGYDPKATSQESRVLRKLNELRDQGISMSRATLYRKLAAWRADGRSALIDGRSLRQFDPTGQVPPVVLDALLDVLAETTHAATRTRAWVIEEVRKRVRRTEGPDFAFPSDASMYRYLHALAPAKNLSAKATTRRSAADRPQRTFGKNSQRFPGAEVQVDSTVLDVLVRTANGKPQRPTVSILLDIGTRMVLGVTLRLKATKGIDHVYLLAQALTPRMNRPDVTGFRTFLQEHMPNHTLLDADEYRRLALAQPYIRPRSITTDRGMDYLSSTFHAAAELVGCDVVLSPPRTPTTKAHVERMFGTINTSFAQNLPGYTGGDVTSRGHKPEDDDLLTIEMVWALLDDWLMNVYHQRPHDGLRDRQMPTRRISPLEAARTATLDVAQFAPAFGETAYIAWLPTKRRNISDTGVQVNTRHYDSEELHQYRGKVSPDPRHGGKWPVKVDPYNPDCVWVEIDKGEFIQCRERGITDRNLLPVWEPAVQDARTLTAQFDAAVTGTPMPTPAPLPTFTTSDSSFDDDELEDYDFATL